MLLFKPFRLDLSNEQLWLEDRQLKIMPRTFEVLRYLVERPQRLITKRELLEGVWSGVFVGEAVLKAHIREIRRSLGDRPMQPRFIETVHRRGYRFVAHVESVPSSRGANSAAPDPAAQAQVACAVPGRHVVGRHEQIGCLEAMLVQAQLGRRQLVFVTGEAGIGKTTLVNQFLAHLGPEPHLWIASGQCIEQYGSGAAYLPFLEAFGRLCTGQDAEAILEVLRRHAPSWLAQMPEVFDRAASSVAALPKFPATPERLLREMAEAIPVMTSQRPLLLVLEDLHWVDPSTLSLLSYLAQSSNPARFMVLGTYRSLDVRLTEHPLWGVHQLLQMRDHCEELALQKLDEGHVVSYLAGKFPRHRFPIQLAREIFRMTSGNPLFMVRVVDGLVKRDVIEWRDEQWIFNGEVSGIAASVPTSVVTLIESELQRLSQDQREVLEVASVAGVEFTPCDIAGVLERDPVEVEDLCNLWLRQGRFLERIGASNSDDLCLELQCKFSHALYPQIIYGRLGPARRKQLHLRLGLQEESKRSPQVQPFAALLAMHFMRADERHRAIRYGRMAGEQAVGRSAYSEAIQHLRSALEILDRTPGYPERAGEELALLLALGAPLVATLGYAAPELEQLYARAASRASKIDHIPSSFTVQAGICAFELVRGRPRPAMEAARRCLELAGTAADAGLLLDAELNAGIVCLHLGEFASADLYISSALARHPIECHRRTTIHHESPFVMGQLYSALLLWFAGYPERALARAEEAVGRTDDTTAPFSMAVAVHSRALLYLYLREGALLMQFANRLAALCVDHGFAYFGMLATALQGQAALLAGDLEGGIAKAQGAWNALKAVGAELGGTQLFTILAEAHLSSGDIDRAFCFIREALDLMNQTGERYWEPEIHRVHGEVCASASAQRGIAFPSRSTMASEAEASFQTALRRSREMGARSFELRATTSLARYWLEERPSQARGLLREVLSGFSEGQGTPDQINALQLLTELEP